MTLLMAMICIILLIVYLVVKPPLRQSGPYLPDSYLFGVGGFAFGATLLEWGYGADNAQIISLISLISLMTSLSGSIFFAIVTRRKYNKFQFIEEFKRVTPGPIERKGIMIGMGVCALVMILFLVSVLRNDSVVSLLIGFTDTSDKNLISARKLITSGDAGYFAPGYVKQFRDILAPILLVAMSVQIGARPWSSGEKILYYSFFLLTLLSMLSTGQRGIVIMLFVTLIFSRYYSSKLNRNVSIEIVRKKRHTSLPLILAAVVLYGVLTFLLGRLEGEQSLLVSITQIFIGLFDRIILTVPKENMITYPIWSEIAPTYGISWLTELGKILPGIEGSSFSNQLHSFLGGSEQGNAPLGLPTDTWLAWGALGIIIIPFLYAFSVGCLDFLLHSCRSPMLIASRFFLMVALPTMYSPYGFVLYGGVAVLVLLSIILFLRSA